MIRLTSIMNILRSSIFTAPRMGSIRKTRANVKRERLRKRIRRLLTWTYPPSMRQQTRRPRTRQTRNHPRASDGSPRIGPRHELSVSDPKPLRAGQRLSWELTGFGSCRDEYAATARIAAYRRCRMLCSDSRGAALTRLKVIEITRK
jgi:hypothetical protein